MVNVSLRAASICCLAIWAAIWFLFLSMRLSPFDIRMIPGIGRVMLVALGLVLLTPVAATALAGAALIRRPRMLLTWLTLGCAFAVVIGQGLLFMIFQWM